LDFAVSTTSDNQSSLRLIFRSAIFLFITLVCWSLASPAGSSPDENFHIINIWCAEGTTHAKCTQPGLVERAKIGVADIDQSSCVFERQDEFQRCDQIKPFESVMRGESYPNGYYRIMNMFHSLPGSLGLLTMRFLNGLIASLFLIAQLCLVDRKQRIAWLTSFTLTLIPMSIFLLSSIHPHAWGITGCAHAWMFLLSALKGKQIGCIKHYLAWAAWLTSGLICLVSRYDTFLFFLASSILTVFAAQLSVKKIMLKRIFWIGTLTSIMIVLLVFLIPMLRVILQLPFDPSLNQYTNSTWLGAWVVRAAAIPLEILGSGVMGQNFVQMPPLVWIFGSTCVSATLAFAAVRVSRKQVVIFTFSTLLLFYIIIWFNNEMYRDLENMNGRYIVALIPFIFGLFIYLSDSSVQMMEIRNLRFVVIALLSAANSISIRTLLDRSINGDFYEFSMLPLKLDQADWWWVGIPFGPNFIWALASIAFFRFLSLVWSTVSTIQPTSIELIK
jgi:hypothetical protein